MKTGKKNLLYLFSSIGLTVVIAMTGCKKNSPEINNITEEKTEKLAVEDFVKDIEKIAKLGFDPKTIEITPNGYLVEGDILLTRKNLDKSVAELSKQQGQYSTRYAVTLKRDIKVALVAPSNTSKFKQAFDASLLELNSLKVSLDFIAEKDTTKADIIVKFDDLGRADAAGKVFLGRAEFVDAQGNPGKYIWLNSHPDAGLASKTTENLTAILSHEFGHALGLRHTDYKNRIYSQLTNNGYSPDVKNQDSLLTKITKDLVDSKYGAGTWKLLPDISKYLNLVSVLKNSIIEPETTSNDSTSTAIHIYGTPESPTFAGIETTDSQSLMLANSGPYMPLKFSLYDNIAFFGLYGNTAQKAHVSANLGKFGNIKVPGKTLKDIVKEVKAKK